MGQVTRQVLMWDYDAVICLHSVASKEIVACYYFFYKSVYNSHLYDIF